MEKEEVKQKLIDIFGAQIKFNRDFDDYISRLKDNMIVELIEWCSRCKERKEIGSQPKNKEYKHLYVFFRKIGSDVRAILIKEKNNDFIELHLFDHKSYDNERMNFGFKKSSYYGS